MPEAGADEPSGAVQASAPAEPEPAPAEPEPEPAPEPEPEAEPEPDYLSHAPFMRTARGFFRPDDPLTRAALARLLCNLTGSVMDADAFCPYLDVPEDSWYYGAVCAAARYFPANIWLFRPDDTVTLGEFTDALNAALNLTIGRWNADLRGAYRALLARAPEPDAAEADSPLAQRILLTRADAAVLVCRALGRSPDEAAIRQTGRSLLLDVSEERSDYCDIVEAVIPHKYLETDGSELWPAQTLEKVFFTRGVHLGDGDGYVVDSEGRVLRGSGILEYNGWKYLSADDSGRIFADGALHPYDGGAVYARKGGELAAGCTLDGMLFDENGFYTTGDTELDGLVRAVIAKYTTENMTQLEKLRACYDYVRTFRYLGRNAAYGAEVRTIPYDAQLQFAKKIFTTGKGDCYNFTAAFCLLARQLGFSAECIVGECAYYWNWNGIAHGWVEVEIDGQTWLFDPQIENYNLRAGLSNEAFSAFQVKYETAHAYYMKH